MSDIINVNGTSVTVTDTTSGYTTTIEQTANSSSILADVTNSQDVLNYDLASSVISQAGLSTPTGTLTEVDITYTVKETLEAASITNSGSTITSGKVTLNVSYSIGLQDPTSSTTAPAGTDTTPDAVALFSTFTGYAPDLGSDFLYQKIVAAIPSGTTVQLVKINNPIGFKWASAQDTATVTAADPSAYAGTGTYDISYATDSPILLTVYGSVSASDTIYTTSALQVDYVYTCYCAGTRIRGFDGDIFIENLAPGDLVMTDDGRLLPVRWIGRQTVATRFANPGSAMPIRIKAGALGENLPLRDLLVSPAHALRLGDLLVQAGALVNGVSIVQETVATERFEYFQIELDEHVLVLAEGVPAESFVDNVERIVFDNWAEYQALYPEGRSVAEMDMPRVQSARQFPPSLRSALAVRAAALNGDTLKAA